MNRRDKIHATIGLTEAYIRLNTVSGYAADNVRDSISNLIKQITQEALEDQPEPDEPTDNARNYTAF